jgi:hypothetical protein
LLRRGFEPYRRIEKYLYKPSLPTKCEKCAGENIFHKLTLEAKSSWAELLSANMLPEFIVGYSLAQSKKVRKVYIHKKVQLVKDGTAQPSRQIDVFSITDLGKILIAEVTTSSDWNDIVRIEKEKTETLKGIPYDYLLIVTGAHPDRYMPLNNSFILGPKSLVTLPELIDRIISGNPPRHL